jgi:predicted esterase
MCCALPEVEGLTLDLAAAAGTPALIQVGEKDQIIAPARGRAAATALRDAGWSVTELGYEMGHSQTIEMMVDARTWLAQ